MLKKTASGVLASLSGSTYRSVRLAASLAAALLDSLFEHPAWLFSVVSHLDIRDGYRGHNDFSHSLLVKIYCVLVPTTAVADQDADGTWLAI